MISSQQLWAVESSYKQLGAVVSSWEAVWEQLKVIGSGWERLWAVVSNYEQLHLAIGSSWRQLKAVGSSCSWPNAQISWSLIFRRGTDFFIAFLERANVMTCFILPLQNQLFHVHKCKSLLKLSNEQRTWHKIYIHRIPYIKNLETKGARLCRHVYLPLHFII